MRRKIGLVVPVMINFKGYCQLIRSLFGEEIVVAIADNWVRNKGVSAGWNEGIGRCILSNCTHILVCNDDIVMMPGSLKLLADRLDEDDDICMTTGNNVRDQEADGFVLHRDVEVTDDIINFLDRFAGQEESDTPDFSCFMITPETYGMIGKFDENFRPAYFEDNDYHYRIKLAGSKTARMLQVPIFHPGSATQNHPDLKGQAVAGREFELNRRYYVSKWGGPPGQEAWIHPFNDPNRDWSSWSPMDRIGY